MAQLLDALDMEERMNTTPPRTGATPAPRALGLFPPGSIAAAPLVFDQPSPGPGHHSPDPNAGDAAMTDGLAPPAEASEEALEGSGDSDEQAGVDATNPDGSGVGPGLAAGGHTLTPWLARTENAGDVAPDRIAGADGEQKGFSRTHFLHALSQFTEGHCNPKPD